MNFSFEWYCGKIEDNENFIKFIKGRLFSLVESTKLMNTSHSEYHFSFHLFWLVFPNWPNIFLSNFIEKRKLKKIFLRFLVLTQSTRRNPYENYWNPDSQIWESVPMMPLNPYPDGNPRSQWCSPIRTLKGIMDPQKENQDPLDRNQGIMIPIMGILFLQTKTGNLRNFIRFSDDRHHK